MAEQVLRWGILGPGHIAGKFSKALAGTPGMVLQAVGSRDLTRAEAFATAHGAAKAYGSYREVAEDPRVDAVYVATLNHTHCEDAILCLEQGKATLVEKPFALNAASARRMAEAARRNHVFLMEGMWSRFLPATRRARELVASGAIGELRALSADFSFSRPLDPVSRLLNPALGGGGLLDVGVYALAFSSFFFGPHPLEAASFARFGPTGVDEYAAILLRHEDGRIASLTCGVQASSPNEATLKGTEGHLVLPFFARAAEIRLVQGAKEEALSFPLRVNGFEYEIEEFAARVLAGELESPEMPLKETIAILETMDGLRRSWGFAYPGEQV